MRSVRGEKEDQVNPNRVRRKEAEFIVNKEADALDLILRTRPARVNHFTIGHAQLEEGAAVLDKETDDS
jgi:hypothetical protein